MRVRRVLYALVAFGAFLVAGNSPCTPIPVDGDCPPGQEWDATGTECISSCPADMVSHETFCMDRYEASRPDATEVSQGTDSSRAMSRPGVMPWFVNPVTTADVAAFRQACAAAGKRLCSVDEFYEACAGPDGNTYVWGNTWDREVCNCVDSFCDEYCADNGIDPCNLNQNCGCEYYCFRPMPAGSFASCLDTYGAFDINGNVWEIVGDGEGFQIRGGAFNCGGPATRLQCTFEATWTSLYAGFRCCLDR